MGHFQGFAERSRAFARQSASAGLMLFAGAIRQIRLTIDPDRWAAAANWRGRVASVSWPRASIGGALVAGLAVSVWFAVQPSGLRSHPPRLPTEQEWRANQAAAKAMEAELSPALAAANRPVQPGERP